MDSTILNQNKIIEIEYEYINLIIHDENILRQIHLFYKSLKSIVVDQIIFTQNNKDIEFDTNINLNLNFIDEITLNWYSDNLDHLKYNEKIDSIKLILGQIGMCHIYNKTTITINNNFIVEQKCHIEKTIKKTILNRYIKN
jgi:hypothetical protein